jgi:outer membrane protein W
MIFKKRLPVLTLLLLSTIAFSQNPLPKGKAQLNAGLGLSGWGIPVYLGLDYGIHKDVTLGAEVSYREYNEKWNKYYYQHSITGFSGNVNYHFNSLLNIQPDWDFYAGLNIGFYAWSTPELYNGSRKSGLGLAGQLGGRYYFTDRLGINLEFGGGNAFSGGKIGATIKL